MIERILFINSLNLDFLQEVVFSGLYKIMGDKITEYPYKKNYYINMGYPYNISFVNKKSEANSFIKNIFSNWDCIIVGSCKKETLKIYHRMLLLNPKIKKIPSVLIDGGDSSDIGGDAERIFKRVSSIKTFSLIFKREMKEEKINNKIFSLSFAINRDTFSDFNNVDKKYNVFFAFRPTNKIREDIYNILKNNQENSIVHLETGRAAPEPAKKKNGFAKRFLNRFTLKERSNIYQQFYLLKIPPDRYLEYMSKSLIGVSLPGAGFDTYRYWEIPAAKTLLLSLKPSIYIRNNFQDNRSCVFFNDKSEILPVIKHLLQNRNKIEDITARGYEHLTKYHTDIQRANYILNIINDYL
ncbi:MAG: glycosyltransferase [bacterium]